MSPKPALSRAKGGLNTPHKPLKDKPKVKKAVKKIKPKKPGKRAGTLGDRRMRNSQRLELLRRISLWLRIRIQVHQSSIK
jgi:hypothetical protein